MKYLIRSTKLSLVFATLVLLLAPIAHAQDADGVVQDNSSVVSQAVTEASPAVTDETPARAKLMAKRSKARAQAAATKPSPIQAPENLTAAVQSSPDPPLETPGIGAAPIVSEDSLTEANGSALGYSLRAIGAMIVILGMIWISMLLLKRYMPHRFGPLGHKRRIHVLETIPLGEKRSLTIVRIDNQELLLAGTPGSISLLKELGPSVAIEEAATKFEDVLAKEVQTADKTSPSTPLGRLTLLRQELEAR